MRRVGVKLFRNRLDILHVRRVNLFDLTLRRATIFVNTLCNLHVRAVAALFTNHERILTKVVDQHKLVRRAAAHHPRVGEHGNHVLEPCALINPLIRRMAAHVILL